MVWIVVDLDGHPESELIDVFSETFIGTYQRVSISVRSRLKVVDSLSRKFIFLKHIY